RTAPGRVGSAGRGGRRVPWATLVPRRSPRLGLAVEVADEAAQEGHELRADVVAAGGQLDRRPQVVVLVAGVVAGPGEGVGQHAALGALDQVPEGVGDLDLVAGPGLGGPQ